MCLYKHVIDRGYLTLSGTYSYAFDRNGCAVRVGVDTCLYALSIVVSRNFKYTSYYTRKEQPVLFSINYACNFFKQFLYYLLPHRVMSQQIIIRVRFVVLQMQTGSDVSMLFNLYPVFRSRQ